MSEEHISHMENVYWQKEKKGTSPGLYRYWQQDRVDRRQVMWLETMGHKTESHGKELILRPGGCSVYPLIPKFISILPQFDPKCYGPAH